MEEWKEALEAAVNKTIGAWNKASEAFLSHDQKGLIDMWKLFHMRSESRKKILFLIWKKKGLYKNNVNQKSE